MEVEKWPPTKSETRPSSCRGCDQFLPEKPVGSEGVRAVKVGNPGCLNMLHVILVGNERLHLRRW